MKKILLKTIMSLFVCLGLTTTVLAQNVFEVAAGTDGIAAALPYAVSGDIIELTTSGGVYIETDTRTIAVKLTIRAKAGLAAKPVIKGGNAGTAYVFSLNKGGLTLKGIKFDGGTYIINAKTTDVAQAPNLNIKVDDCEFQNWTERAIYISGSSVYAFDSVLVKNSVFKNGIKQGVYLQSTRNASNIFPGSYRYCLVENCLFTGISSSSDGHATYLEPGNREVADKGWPKVIVDHVTVDDCTFGIFTYTTPEALVQNCIVSNLKVTTNYCYQIESGRFNGAPASTVKNSIYYRGRLYPGNAFVASVFENVDSIKPLYKDPANGDYSLLSTSPGKNKGTDGKDLGYISKSVPTSVALIKSGSTAKVYPNPTPGPLHISLGEDITGASTIEIFDVTGNVISKVNVLNDQRNVEIDLSSSPAGIYYGIIKCSYITHSFKVIKE